MKVNNSPSSLHLFKQQGILYVTPDPERPNLDLEEIAIECEAEDVTKETNEEGQEVIKVSSGFLLAKAKKKKNVLFSGTTTLVQMLPQWLFLY